jgi:hypothetical protein
MSNHNFDQLVGWTITQIAFDSTQEPLAPNGHHGLVLVKGKQKKIAWVTSRDHNGAGDLLVEVVPQGKE